MKYLERKLLQVTPKMDVITFFFLFLGFIIIVAFEQG